MERSLNNFIRFWFRSKWRKRITVLFLLFAAIWGTLKLLEETKPEKSLFTIIYDPDWGAVNLDGQEKDLVGFSEDLLSAIGNKEKITFRMTRGSAGQLNDFLDGNRADGTLSLQSPDHLLLDRYVFSDPYYKLGLVLVVPKASDIDSLQDIEGKYIGVLRGSPALYYIPHFEKKGQFITYDTTSSALDDLLNNKIDGVLIGFISASTMEYGYYKGKIKMVTPPLTQEGLRLVSKRNSEGQRLISAFNRGLIAVEKEGLYDKLLDKWNLYKPLIPQKKEGAP